MEGCFWKTLLLVGALLASGDSAPSQRPLTYEEAVEQGVVLYNSKAKEDSLYRLLEAVPQPEWDPNSEDTQELKFTIKETVCSGEEEAASLDKCDFKEGGVIRECTGDFFLGEKPPMAVLTCDVMEGTEEEEEEEVVEEEGEEKKENQEEEEEDQPERFKKLKKGFKTIKDAVKNGIKNGIKDGVKDVIKNAIKNSIKKHFTKRIILGPIL